MEKPEKFNPVAEYQSGDSKPRNSAFGQARGPSTGLYPTVNLVTL